MANEVNLKATFGFDGSGFVKGAKEVRQNLKDLDNVGKDALTSISDLFGVNIDKIEQMASAAAGLGEKLSKSASAGVSSFGNLLKSINGVTVGLAGIGIGAVVTGFKALNAEAETFRSTVEGANLEMATAAYIDTYKMALHDLNKGMGESIANGQSSWKKFWSSIGATFRYSLTSGGFTGQDQLTSNFTEGVSSSFDKARQAQEYASTIYSLQRKQKEDAVEIKKLDSQISDLRKTMIDPEVSITERIEAQKKAAELIAQKYQMQLSTQQGILDNMRLISDLATDTVADTDALLDAEMQVDELKRRQAEDEKSLLVQAKKLTKEAQAQADAAQKQLAAQAAIAAMRDSLNNFDLSISDNAKENIQNAIDKQIGKDLTIEGKIIPKIDKKKAQEEILDFTPIIADAFDTLGESFGNLFTDLRNGENVWQNFTNTAISAFGDMAISVGKMAIATGTASLGIKAALESLNGYAAIAAGVALVALGTAVKQGMSSIANGNYSASSNIASSGSYYGKSMTDYQEREIDVNISGTFTASGNSLVAVIDNENKRKRHTC